MAMIVKPSRYDYRGLSISRYTYDNIDILPIPTSILVSEYSDDQTFDINFLTVFPVSSVQQLSVKFLQCWRYVGLWKVGMQQQGRGASQCCKIFPTVALRKQLGMQSENRCQMCDHCYIWTHHLEDYIKAENRVPCLNNQLRVTVVGL